MRHIKSVQVICGVLTGLLVTARPCVITAEIMKCDVQMGYVGRSGLRLESALEVVGQRDNNRGCFVGRFIITCHKGSAVVWDPFMVSTESPARVLLFDSHKGYVCDIPISGSHVGFNPSYMRISQARQSSYGRQFSVTINEESSGKAIPAGQYYLQGVVMRRLFQDVGKFDPKSRDVCLRTAAVSVRLDRGGVPSVTVGGKLSDESNWACGINVKGNIEFGVTFDSEVIFTNNSKSSRHYYDPGLYLSQAGTQFPAVGVTARKVGTAKDEPILCTRGKQLGPDEDSWQCCPPGGIVGSRVTMRFGPPRREVGSDSVKRGASRWSIRVSLFDRFGSIPPTTIRRDRLDMMPRYLTNEFLERWRREYPGKIIFESTPLFVDVE